MSISSEQTQSSGLERAARAGRSHERAAEHVPAAVGGAREPQASVAEPGKLFRRLTLIQFSSVALCEPLLLFFLLCEACRPTRSPGLLAGRPTSRGRGGACQAGMCPRSRRTPCRRRHMLVPEHQHARATACGSRTARPVVRFGSSDRAQLGHVVSCQVVSCRGDTLPACPRPRHGPPSPGSESSHPISREPPPHHPGNEGRRAGHQPKKL